MELHCEVLHVIYLNSETGWAVFKGRCPEEGKATFTGYLPDITDGCKLVVEGTWKDDRKYGPQICVSSYTKELPVTADGIVAYLSSGMVKGLGPKTARKIVDRFGTETVSVLDGDIGRLSEIKGLGARKIEKIRQGWEAGHAVRNIMMFLRGYREITAGTAVRIYKTYGPDSVKMIKENPYRLADDVWGIGFSTADKVAKAMGIPDDSPLRIEAGVLYTLKNLSDCGHVFAFENQLIEETSGLLGCDSTPVATAIGSLVSSSRLVADGDAVYSKPLYRAECAVASRLVKIRDTSPLVGMSVNPHQKSSSGISYTAEQQDAIRTALREKVMILTGGPGTGKTTTLKGMLDAYEACHATVLQAAPTGRAAKKMQESTGRESKTIHRLLEYRPDEGFTRNADHPLEGDVLVVDECSMIDIRLMESLLRAVPSTMRVVFVGDSDQLPSVGPGSVFRDLIASGSFPVCRLNYIHRQNGGSMIVENSHLVNERKMPVLANAKGSDCYFIECDEPSRLPGLISSLVKDRIPKAFGIRPEDVQVLSPTRKGEAGTSNLNQILQDALNPSSPAVEFRQKTFRIGDKVMQIVNNYEKEVYNGDVGIITEADTEESEITVEYDGRPVSYDRTDMDEVTTAYAATIHKSQGSEYRAVVLPMTTSHYYMLKRNLLYTAMTRARDLLVIVGSRKAIGVAVHTDDASKRNSKLSERLSSARAPHTLQYQRCH